MLNLEQIALLLNTANLGVYNKIDNTLNTIFLGRFGQNHDKKKEVIGIYAQTPSETQPKAIGSLSSYSLESFEIMLIWNESYNESESKAIEIFNFFLDNFKSILLNDGTKILTINSNKPIHLGIQNNTNSHGFKIDFTLTKTK